MQDSIKRLSACRDGDEVQLIVGPEGDFTPTEVHQLLDAGALAVGLGPLRLRVETAAVALLAAATAFQRSRQSANGVDATG
jgi:16S rRNA (uracil1498-N3)-methyltransferase